MRMPLKFQIMVPMSCVLLATLALVSVISAWMAGSRTRQRIERQLQDIGRTLSNSSFPLTDRVLKQMHGLSGAQFIVVNENGVGIATSDTLELGEIIAPPSDHSPVQATALNQLVRRNGKTYFHVPLDLRRAPGTARPVVLHCFYPESDYRQAWREAVWPPVALSMVSLVVVVVISSVIAMRVTRPVHRLRDQVHRISRGDFRPLPVPSRNDELRDLSNAVNTMAELLAQYESQVRNNERLRTLDRLGGGIAHQLRNSVTGCRIAVDLHRRRCSGKDDESVRVAIQQLELMEEYLQRFLSIGKQPSRPFAPVDLAQTVERILPLVRPRIDHLGIVFQWHCPDEQFLVSGDADSLSQVVVNLLINAMDAATQFQSECDGINRIVAIRLEQIRDSRIRLKVSDSGPGPDPRIQDSLFEPMVSSKQDGVGLGLAIVHEAVANHGGTIDWCRHDDMTCFSVELPTICQETKDANVACCRR